MTWTFLTHGTSGVGGSGSISSDVFTPAPNSIVGCVACKGGADFTGGSGHGTMIKIHDGGNDAANNADWEVWACLTGASPTASAITMTRGYWTQGSVVFFEINETDGFPDTIEECFGTPDANNYYGNEVTLEANVPPFEDANHMALAFLSADSNSAGQWSTAPDYTEVIDFNGNKYSVGIHYKDTEDNPITADSAQWGVFTAILGFEIKKGEAGPGPGPSIAPLAMHHQRQQR